MALVPRQLQDHEPQVSRVRCRPGAACDRHVEELGPALVRTRGDLWIEVGLSTVRRRRLAGDALVRRWRRTFELRAYRIRDDAADRGLVDRAAWCRLGWK